MLAALANPLIAAMIKGQPDLFQGLIGAFDQQTRKQLVGNADTYVAQLIRCWLEPEQLPSDTTASKQALGEWLENFFKFAGDPGSVGRFHSLAIHFFEGSLPGT